MEWQVQCAMRCTDGRKIITSAPVDYALVDEIENNEVLQATILENLKKTAYAEAAKAKTTPIELIDFVLTGLDQTFTISLLRK